MAISILNNISSLQGSVQSLVSGSRGAVSGVSSSQGGIGQGAASGALEKSSGSIVSGTDSGVNLNLSANNTPSALTGLNLGTSSGTANQAGSDAKQLGQTGNTHFSSAIDNAAQGVTQNIQDKLQQHGIGSNLKNPDTPEQSVIPGHLSDSGNSLRDQDMSDSMLQEATNLSTLMVNSPIATAMPTQANTQAQQVLRLLS